MSERHRVFYHSSERMPELADREVQLMVTSPPYGLGLPYGTTPGQKEVEGLTAADFERFGVSLNPIWRECYRVLCPGGFAAINVPLIWNFVEYDGWRGKGSYDFPGQITRRWVEMGAVFWGRYLWDTPRTHHAATGGNGEPTTGRILRSTEEILVFRAPGQRPPPATREESTLGRAEWLDLMAEVWHFRPTDKVEDNGTLHPAPYPIDVPRRIIRAYSYRGDTVLDPFLGTGTTSQAAREEGRDSVGYEIEERFRPIIEGTMKVGEPGMVGGEEW